MTNNAPFAALSVIERCLAKGLEVQFYTAQSDPTDKAPARFVVRVYRPGSCPSDTEMTASGETMMEALVDLARADEHAIASVGYPFEGRDCVEDGACPAKAANYAIQALPGDKGVTLWIADLNSSRDPLRIDMNASQAVELASKVINSLGSRSLETYEDHATLRFDTLR